MSALPAIVMFLLRSAAAGALIGVGLASLFVVADTGGLGTLIADSADPVVPLLLLALGFATMFGSVYTGAAIMLLPKDERHAIWRNLDR